MHSDDLGGQYFFLEKQGSAYLGDESPAIRFKALVRASPSGFTLLSGLFNNGSAFHIDVPNLAGLIRRCIFIFNGLIEGCAV
jgi:hypothetical protein